MWQQPKGLLKRAAWIDNTFDESALATIKLQNDLYNWRDSNGRTMEDRPTKLKLILEDIQAAQVVSADMYHQQIQGAHPKKYNHDVNKVLEDITRCYKEIVRVGKSYDSLCLSVFNCLGSTYKEQYLQDVC